MYFNGELDVILSKLNSLVNDKVCSFVDGAEGFYIGNLASSVMVAQDRFHGKGNESTLYRYYSQMVLAIKSDSDSLYNLYNRIINLSNQVYKNIVSKQKLNAGEEVNVDAISDNFGADQTIVNAVNSLELRYFEDFIYDNTTDPTALNVWVNIRDLASKLYDINADVRNQYATIFNDTEWGVKEELLSTFNKIDERIGNLYQVICECGLSVGDIANEVGASNTAFMNDLASFQQNILSAFPGEAINQVKENYRNAYGKELGTTPIPGATPTPTPTPAPAPEPAAPAEQPAQPEQGNAGGGEEVRAAQTEPQQPIQQPVVEGIIGGEGVHTDCRNAEFNSQAGIVTGGHQSYSIVPDSEYTGAPGTISQSEYQIVIAQVAGEGANNAADMFGVATTMFNRRDTGGGFGNTFTQVLQRGYWPWGETYRAYMPGGKYYNTQWGKDKLAVAKQVVDQALAGYRNLPSNGYYYYGNGKNNFFRC